MRRIFKLKTRKEDPRRYINVESENVTSTYGELAGYVSSAVRWVKKIIHTNDENSALPAWIACNRFYSKPQEINRVHKRKVPQHMQDALNKISEGFTPANLAIQRLKHEKILQERMRVQAIQAAIQRRKALEQSEYVKPRKIIQKFTIYYTEEQKKPFEQDFVERKVTLALDLLRQEVRNTFDNLDKYQETVAPYPKTTENIPKPTQIEKQQEKQQISKPIVESHIQIEKSATSPIESLIKPILQEENVSKSNNPFIGTVPRNLTLTDLISSTQQASQLFTSNHQIQAKREDSLPINNNHGLNQQSNNPYSSFPNQNISNTAYHHKSQFQLPTIQEEREESTVSSYSLAQNSFISNQNHANRNTNISQYSNHNQQQNMQLNQTNMNNPPSFTNGINPNLMGNNKTPSSFFQTSSKNNNHQNLFVYSDNKSQATLKTQKKNPHNRSAPLRNR